jgi:uncharacterized protein (DUF1778 family)
MSEEKGRRGTKTAKVTVYMTSEEERVLTHRAAQLGQPLGRFLVENALREAESRPLERELLLLNEELTEARVLAKQALDGVDALREALAEKGVLAA